MVHGPAVACLNRPYSASSASVPTAPPAAAGPTAAAAASNFASASASSGEASAIARPAVLQAVVKNKKQKKGTASCSHTSGTLEAAGKYELAEIEEV